MKAYILRRRGLGKTSCEAIENFSKQNIVSIRNDHIIPIGLELCIRWGCTSNIPQRKVVNDSKYIHLVNNKTEFRRILNDNNLCPKTWFNTNDNIFFPVIVRPEHHSRGRNIYYCENNKELVFAIERCYPNYYISEFINKIEEYRVFCAQGRIICVAKKTPKDINDIAWNVAKGGRFDNVRWGEWNLNVLDKAISAFNLSELDFGGVDVMVDKEGQSYILEINSAPSLTSPYRQQCFSLLFDWIVENKEENIPITHKRRWRDFIHPCIINDR